MRITFYDTHGYERHLFEQTNKKFAHELHFVESRLTQHTAQLAHGSDCVCSFVNDHLDRSTIEILNDTGVRLIALRCAGFNHVDLRAINEFGLRVVRVPEYSPYAVAEHAVSLILTLNRQIHRAYWRVRDGNFSLSGLVGFDIHGKKVGIIGTGRIGMVLAKIMTGFGCEILAYDTQPSVDVTSNKQVSIKYVTLETLLRDSDIISLHVPLNPNTHHLINENTISLMKPHVMLINTGRGALIDTRALITALKKEKIGYAGLDVYEEEEGVFFEDLSGQVIQDDTLARLLTFPNVLITSHQGFLTREALSSIASTTLQNISDFEDGKSLENEVHPEARIIETDGFS